LCQLKRIEISGLFGFLTVLVRKPGEMVCPTKFSWIWEKPKGPRKLFNNQQQSGDRAKSNIVGI
jgi:hypothetical protein